MTTAELIDKYDSGNILGTLKDFPNQVRSALALKAHIEGEIKNIVLSGMGGSALGGQLLQGLIGQELAAPFFIHRDYRLPAFVGKDTLVIIVSYSGNTEEALSSFEDAIAREARTVVISSGGKLGAAAKKRSVPVIGIPEGLIPRMAWGYTSLPILNILRDLHLTEVDLSAIPEILVKQSENLSNLDGSEAIDLAAEMKGSIPVFYSSNDQEILAYKWKTNVNESAKQAAFANYLPEMNHNELNGWQNPPAELSKFKLFMLKTGFESPEVGKRLEATKEVLGDAAGGIYEIASSGANRIEAIFSNLYLGDFVSYYLGVLNEVDPGPVPVIENFKSIIAKRS